MKAENGYLIFDGGRKVTVALDFLCINPEGTCAAVGVNEPFYPFFWRLDKRDEGELSQEERAEVADFAIARWQMFKEVE